MLRLSDIALLAFDLDGTLTDGTTWWGGEHRGWLQRYSVRDGEAILRLKQHVPVLPLSRNKTLAARVRMEGLSLDTRWLGVGDKTQALEPLCLAYGISPSQVVFVGDGPEDALIFERVGLGCAVADAHPRALAAAHHILQSRGGSRALEELETLLTEAS